MYYKEDWPNARKRLEAFWRHEMIDRACVGVLAPRKTSYIRKFSHLTNGPWLGGLEKLADDDKEGIRKWWTDPEENYKRMKLWMDNTCFVGEAVPGTYINWGASAGCAFWGAEPQFSKTSVWFPRVIDNWETWQWNFEMEFNPFFKNILSIMELFIEKNNESYFIGVPEIGNAADNLSQLRGMSDLATDLFIYPEAVKEAVEIMSDAWVDAEKVLFDMSVGSNDHGGVLAWLNLWAPGSHDQIANDFSSMLSTDMFIDFFFPELRKMGQHLNYATFHLDGPHCIRHHVDALITLDEIKCIQFTPGAGSPRTSHSDYIPIFQKIQQSGKNLYLLADPDEIEYLLEHLSARGLYINTYADSEKEANNLVKKVEQWSKERF